MKKIASLALACILGTSFLATSFAIDTKNSARIIDDFALRQKKILFENQPFSDTGVNEALEHEYRINGLEALRARMASFENYYIEKKTEVGYERISLENALKKLDVAIAATTKAIEDIRITIDGKQREIVMLERTSDVLKKKIQTNRKIILDYLANLYSEGNQVMDTTGEVDIFKTLILTDTAVDFQLTDMTYKILVSELGQKFVDEYRSAVRTYYVNGVKLKEEKHTLQNLEVTLKKQGANLEAQKIERTNILEITKGQEARYAEYIARQQESQKQVTQAWKKATENYQETIDSIMKKQGCDPAASEKVNTPECIRVRQFFMNETKLSKVEYATGTSNIFSWPVVNPRITTYFRDPAYYRLLHTQHDAIDIATPQGSPITAPADGYVYYINEPKPGNYSYMAIKHKGGLVTVYGHLSEVTASLYQYVHEGEVIAKSGGAPGTPGAGPMTTGAHLHFEVWKDEEPVDPLRYLSLTKVDYKKLPPRFQMKFVQDMVEANSGSTHDINGIKVRFVLKGDSEEARQKYLLTTYATPAFRNWNLWIDTALENNIDPSFLMCIGLAETTLGNHLKTAYNIGNVGNNDRGDVVSFASPKEGITWMAKTFNNRFLKKYTKLSELSRWGNKAGSIYASSGGNWHDNNIRCLSALKGEFVDDNFSFRVKNK